MRPAEVLRERLWPDVPALRPSYFADNADVAGLLEGLDKPAADALEVAACAAFVQANMVTMPPSDVPSRVLSGVLCE